MSYRDIRAAAMQRSWLNRGSATHDGELGDPARIDLEGRIGEEVFAKRFDLEHQLQDDHPVAWNFQLNDGTRVDVRSSSRKGANLIVPPSHVRRPIDAFVLVEVDPKRKTGIIRGWATRNEVRAVEPREIRRGATPVHLIYYRYLHPIEELLERHLPKTLPLFGKEIA